MLIFNNIQKLNLTTSVNLENDPECSGGIYITMDLLKIMVDRIPLERHHPLKF